ncbi:MAG: L,D-transpeptidase [Nanoarchaeota archaeon]
MSLAKKISLASIVIYFFLNGEPKAEELKIDVCKPTHTLEDALVNRKNIIGNCRYVIDISLEEHTLYFYGNGALLTSGVISSPRIKGDKKSGGDGKIKYGAFKLHQFEKREPEKFGYGFIRIDFSSLGFHGFGLHGTPLVQSLGFDASRGCIRTENEIIRYIVQETGENLKDTLIIIKP